MQEQLFDVLRAALGASLEPLLEKQQELEARLVALHQAMAAKAPTPSIPVTIAPSVAPAAPATPAAPSVTPPQLAVGERKPLASVAPRTASLVPTSYGFVIAPDGPAPRPAIDVALEDVGPLDVPDFGRGRRAAGRIFVGLLLAGLAAVIAATILSYT